MFDFYFGTDREMARKSLLKRLGQVTSTHEVLRITDAHTISDLQAALQGGGMFTSAPVVVFDSILGGAHEDMRQLLSASLKRLGENRDQYFILEGALDAATRKLVEKYADKTEKFDAPKKEKDNTIFTLANALQKGDRKALWIGLMREYAKGSAPEAVHGLLFWGAKQMLLRGHASDSVRGRNLVAALAELPHEARRRGEDLEYALERYVLTKEHSGA